MSERSTDGDGRPREAPGTADAAGSDDPGRIPADDPTVVALGTSLTWCTGNAYEYKYPDLVHRDLTGDYPIDEKYLHYDDGDGEIASSSHPDPEYYERTVADGYAGGDHPDGDHIPPVQYRARGGAIIGLSEPYRRATGVAWHEIETNDQGDYLVGGDYYGKLDHLDDYRGLFDETDINTSAWTIARDVGWHWPTIVQQIGQFPDRGDPKPSLDVPTGPLGRFGNSPPDDEPPDGADVDLVIVDGGTNDVELGWLNDPKDAGRTTIWQAIRRHMYDDMVGQDGLLRRVRRKFPSAVIVLVGEPVYASNRTHGGKARKFLGQSSTLGIGYVYPGAVEQAVDNALNFARMAPYCLRKAVAEEAWRDPGPGIVYAPSGYGVVNSMMADWPWSWGFVANAGDGYSPDDTVNLRRDVCQAEDAREPGNRAGGKRGDDADEIAFPACPAASIGHPNHEGCRQYADAIVRRYKHHVDRSAGTVEDELNGSGTSSLKTALQRHGFDPGSDGIRRPLAHRTVDSIRVKCKTESGPGMGVKRGRVYLKVYPGRTGDGEAFRLDNESNDLRPGGPRSAGPSSPDDEFYVDPMMGRRLSGPPGNTDRAEVGVSKEDETKLQAYRNGDDRWDDRPLRLGDVKHATLVLDGVDPSDGWAIDEIQLELNGWVERTIDMSVRDDKNYRSGSLSGSFSTREFHLASFNEVDGLVGEDLVIDVVEDSISLNVSGGSAYLDLDVRMRNDTGNLLPALGIEYYMEVKNLGGNFTGRDNQFEPLGSFEPGESRRLNLSLAAANAANVATDNDIRLQTVTEVNRYTWGDELVTSKSDI